MNRLNYFSLLISLLMLGGVVTAQKGAAFTISGNIKNYSSKYIYLHHKWDDKDFSDSAKVEKGEFSFKGKTPEPNMYWFTTTNNINAQPNSVFFVDGGKYTAMITGDSIAYANIKGGQTQTDYLDYRIMMGGFGALQNQIYQNYMKAQGAGDMAGMQAAQAEFEKLNVKAKDNLRLFIKNHPKSAISGYIINFEYNNPQVKIEELEEVVGYLDKSIKQTKFGKMAQKRLDGIKGTTVGYPAINFSQKSPDGKSISLSDYKGKKYVLVDFWASWCGPCRAENPNVVAAYTKFKDKGFTVLGVSFDQNKDQWMAAVQKDNLTWDQVSDLKGWGNEVGKMYGITSIPQNLLIDKDGKILGKNLRGPALEEKLSEIFK